MPIVWAITAGCCNALSGLFTKQVERTQCRPAQFSLLFMGTITVSAAVFSVVGGAWGPLRLWLAACLR